MNIQSINNLVFMDQKNVFQLQKDEFVIHLKHGLGQYLGLTTIENNNVSSEYFTILYANHAKLYVPITQLYLIKKYNCSLLTKKINLHKLGCKKWNQERKKIFKNINDTAVQILENHAQRMIKPGFSFQKYSKEYKKFCSDFPFKLTHDQNLAVKSVLSDMYKPTNMNRLICGDVGFGKTEIAIRASFIAVKNNKQVIVLVPTTLLAQQHYNTFQNRFLKYDIKIDILSRFQNSSNCIESMHNIKNGYTNIVITTHKILFSNVHWFNLGLLIIDEEHRFGVQQKESIKKNFSNIDILILTATPIPRTLNMAIHGIHDLSIIKTPPNHRLPVKTFLKTYNDQLIKKIILFEVKRNGQLYYICNKIKNLKEKLYMLQKNIPEVKFRIGHGGMNGITLKNIMDDFYKKKFQVLICTTIIETGIDIPTVNSIIIEDAESFGLAQLHQMRGRVGRSNIQSYAWFFTKNKKMISLNGKKRLQVIENTKNFKSGFEISQHDLNIRGVGELLGKHQSGHSKNIELSLYKEFLYTSIQYIKKNKSLSLSQIEIEQPEIKLSITAILPENYIKDVNIRLIWYKKIFSVCNRLKLLKIKKILKQKFGKLPEEVENLMLISEIKLLSKNIGIIKIDSNTNSSIISFHKNTSINILKLIKFCKIKFTKWQLYDQYSLKIFYYFINDNKRIQWIFDILEHFNEIFK